MLPHFVHLLQRLQQVLPMLRQLQIQPKKFKNFEYTDHTTHAAFDSLISLQARLVLLERSLNIKREPTNPTIHNNIMTTVKRERIDKENTPDCKRRKLTKAIEVVDLTAD